MSSLVIYFSRNGENYFGGELKNIEKGNTEVIAEYIQELDGADLFKVEPAEEYPADYMKCIDVAKKEFAKNARPEIKEELDTEIKVGDLIDTIEYDYPTFHLSMDCFWCEIVSGDLVLKEHEAAKWLKKDELDSVEWLPADITLIEKIKDVL